MRIATNRTYRLAAAGVRALASEKSVPAWYRTLLGLIQGETAASVVRESMNTQPAKQVLAWIDELETLGFIELVVLAPPVDAPERSVIDPQPEEQAA
jgi:hypothetical protein